MMYLKLFLFTIFNCFYVEVYSSYSTTTEFIGNEINHAHIAGASVIVFDRSNILYQKSFGFESIENKKLISDQSIFLLASISKTFIAIAAMQLVEQNKLNLDSDVNIYLSTVNLSKLHHPLYPNDIITMKHLLTHTASITIDTRTQFSLISPYDNYTKTTIRQLYSNYLIPGGSLYSKNNWLNSTVGTEYHYSNMGTTVAALIIEIITSISYDNYIRKNILEPLDIQDASYALSGFSDEQKIHLVQPYAYNVTKNEAIGLTTLFNIDFDGFEDIVDDNGTKWLHISLFGYLDWPSGLLRMSALSLVKYLQMFMNNGTSLNKVKILNSQSVALIRQVHFSISPPFMSSGLLWSYENYTSQSQNHIVFGHHGAVVGTRTAMFYDPLTNIGVILLSNADTVFNSYQTKIVEQTFNNIITHLFDYYNKHNHSEAIQSYPFIVGLYLISFFLLEAIAF
ncbi:unnamed protein product [Didymodactylos carnosus]|uniref:Beta-lactamase-related domain-containing protein n=1 Tax=Didymodactylos carnosus TaxID=1234261 RepID=A0A815YND5_9BILA|nr:unnamed protein product [Didymodactylos carnosus]CAF1573348.1 unnamed protein product [Didymodactylos carnosus]CAF4154289.1 unnamed protein product [Didymodactylos carnosus]CAF4437260.1 unnamed protein product [Didymodactylos carnosus]